MSKVLIPVLELLPSLRELRLSGTRMRNSAGLLQHLSGRKQDLVPFGFLSVQGLTLKACFWCAHGDFALFISLFPRLQRLELSGYYTPTRKRFEPPSLDFEASEPIAPQIRSLVARNYIPSEFLHALLPLARQANTFAYEIRFEEAWLTPYLSLILEAMSRSLTHFSLVVRDIEFRRSSCF